MKIKYIKYNVQDYIVVSINALRPVMLFAQLHVKVGILLTCGKDLHDLMTTLFHF